MASKRQEQATALRRRLMQAHPPREPQLRSLGDAVDACVGGGLKCGALHEIFPAVAADAAAAGGFTLALAATVTGKKNWLLWVQQDFAAVECGDLLGTGVCALGFDPARLIIVKAPNAAAALRAGAEGLACDAIGAVVIEAWRGAKIFDLVASRKLTLAAAKHGATAFTLRHGATPLPSAAETRWRIAAASSGHDMWDIIRFDAELLRNRHGVTGRWIMEWDCNGHFRESWTADCGGLVAAALDRPAAAQTENLRRAG